MQNSTWRRREVDTTVQTTPNNPKYILINITSGAAAATVCRQHQDAMGLEVSSGNYLLEQEEFGYLTKLLKQKFDNNNFEESFSTWEFELARYERDNSAQLPDQVKIAVLMNETTGPLQQHLHLNAGTTPTYAEVRATIMEYYRTTTAFSRLQQHLSSAVVTNLGGGPAPMDIGATYKGKGKGKGKNKGKGYGKGNKGKGYQEGKATAYTTKESPKENSSHGISQKEETKATKERQNKCLTKEKERIQQQCATGVANLATWQKNAQQRCTTCQKHRKSNTKMEQHSGMTQTMGTTTTGTATTSQATTAYNQLSSSNNWLCQHHPLTAKHHQSTLWQHWASRRRVNTGM